MKFKTKLLLSFGFLFIIILLLGLVGSFYVKKLGEEASNILKDNNRTLQYMQRINTEIDAIEKILVLNLPGRVEPYLSEVNAQLRLQKNNITETGEAGLTQKLEKNIKDFTEILDKGRKRESMESLFLIRELTDQIYEINQEKISESNQKVNDTSDRVFVSMVIIAFATLVIGLFFTFGMPGYLTRSIKKFDKAIDKVSRGIYDVNVPANRKDEFGHLAASFNLMALKLKEFEQSNYAKILFEKNRLDTIINQLSEAIIGLDQNKHILFVNQRALALLGLKQKEIRGKYAPDIAMHNELMQNLIRELMIGGYTGDYASHPIKVTEDKKEKSFSKDIIDIITNPTGEGERKILIGHVIILTDITEFADKDKAKTRFMATLSHELKTPVAAIDMGAGLLQNKKTGTLNEEQEEWVKTIVQNNDRIKRTINEILDLSKIESGSIDVLSSRTKVGYLVDSAILGIQPFIKDKKLTVQNLSVVNESEVLADPQKVIWILNNFLTNAIRYSPEEGTIKVSAEAEGYFIRISVTDQGKGVDPAQKKTIFKPYSRLKGDQSEGTGLGLAISKEFVEAMGGSIGLFSREDQGVTFWIKLRKP
ncbi:HAMP domain-containing protein [Sinomicrobium pectinilyticum]|uniref:histidine kinase n=1 Tax=Sinomicrobium pectinilyticum TaxID=1084421 RepID=A0A3N0F319_SINP1|nr:ATP-binding protein [Sinomicrobium pectinilyticum]RNL94530.1 HAMP domain-containing protein [Sinomicrobium pectinilyticum]